MFLIIYAFKYTIHIPFKFIFSLFNNLRVAMGQQSNLCNDDKMKNKVVTTWTMFFQTYPSRSPYLLYEQSYKLLKYLCFDNSPNSLEKQWITGKIFIIFTLNIFQSKQIVLQKIYMKIRELIMFVLLFIP